MPSFKTDKKFLKELKKKEMKRKKIKERKKNKAKRRSDSSEDSSSDESDMDLQKELYPISHYINDKEEMINQVCSEGNLNCFYLKFSCLGVFSD